MNFLPLAMNDPVTDDVYQQLDQRHDQVLAELDSLNDRLEQTLGTFGKLSESVELPDN